MKEFDIKQVVRPNVLKMKAYSSARDEFEGEASVFLDANENALGSGTTEDAYNRYPDPRQTPLRKAIAAMKGIQPDQIFLGNGSDEAIDLLFRAFCVPGKDRVLSLPPTYGMYTVQANINETPVDEIELNADFSLPTEKILQELHPDTKIIFICSPNNPSGNLMDPEAIKTILNSFAGLVVVDEAYIDFAPEGSSLVQAIDSYPNLMVLQTFSKAWGLAGLRLGMAYAQKDIIDILCKIKYPYNVNQLTQEKVMQAVQHPEKKEQMVQTLLEQRNWLEEALQTVPSVQKVYPSAANFLLVQIKDATAKYRTLIERGVVVRNRSSVALCQDCLRITVGSAAENQKLVEELKQL